VDRGPIEVFGDFEEFKESGEVETLDDFEQLWKSYHPEETKWYKFQTAKYNDNLYFYLGGKLLWTIIDTEFQEESDKKGWNLQIPFELSDADEIIHMVTGTNFIGIVPDSVFPRYCHGLFPKEDRIIDFMNLGSDQEIVSAIVKKAHWYPLDRIEIAN
jgi:hypothetical protein